MLGVTTNMRSISNYRKAVEHADTSSSGTAILDESIITELTKHAHSSQFIEDVVDSFISDMANLIEQLDAVVEQEQWNELPDIRHAIEGTARGSGAIGINALVKDINSIPAMLPERRESCIKEFRQRFALTQKAMKHLLLTRTVSPHSDGKYPG